MKNKIIIFIPVISVGGVEKNFFLISNYLAKKYEKLSVVSTSYKLRKKLNKNIKFIGPKSFLFEKCSRRLKFIVSLLYLIRQILINKKTIVLCFQANMYCVFVCKLLGAKVILRSNSSPEGWSKNIIKLALYKFGFKLADGIIVNSLQFKRQLRKKFDVKAECIYNPLNKDEIIKFSKNKIKLNFFKKKTLNIINVARFEDQKDHLTLLKAINEIKLKINLRLLLIGNGSKEKLIRNFIEHNNLNNSVKILKNINNPFPYVIKSDIFVLTSIYEGLPNVLLEAIALNKFIISSNCPTGPSEILDNGKGGLLFKEGDYKDLTKKIIFFQKNKNKLANKISYAKKRLNRFDYKNNLKKYKNYLDFYSMLP